MNYTSDTAVGEEIRERPLAKDIEEIKMKILETKAILNAMYSKLTGTNADRDECPEFRCLHDEVIFLDVNAEQAMMIAKKLDSMLF